MFQNEPLGIYLNDHLAGAAGAIELGDRLVDETKGSELGDRLAALIDDIKADRRVLEGLMDGLGVDRDQLKAGLGWVGEKLSRLKLAVGSGPPELGRLLSLEALTAGVHGKLALWQSLQRISDVHPPLAAADLDGLMAGARAQLDLLDDLRTSMAPSALGAAAPAEPA